MSRTLIDVIPVHFQFPPLKPYEIQHFRNIQKE